MQMSKSEYMSFLNSLSLTCNSLKQWLNDVIFISGIPLPYKLDEFKSTLTFNTGSMHFLLDVENEASKWLEDEFIGGVY